MPTLSGPEYLNGQFSVAADGTVSLTTPPLSTAGGTISPGPVVIGNPFTSPPPFSLVINRITSSQPAGSPGLLITGDNTIAPSFLSDGYSISPTIIGRYANGTGAAPTAVQVGAALLNLNGQGRGATAYSSTRAQISMIANQNWTDTAQATFLTFGTTSPNSVTLTQRMQIFQGVVIGNPAVDPGQGGLVLNANAAAPPPSVGVGGGLQLMGVDSSPGYIDMVGIGAGPTVFARRANGTGAALTAVQAGQTIAAFQARGYGATAWSGNRGNIQFVSTENWTDAAQGAALAFVTGANGTTATAEAMRIDHNGNVGIGTTAPAVKLQVMGAAVAGNFLMRQCSGPNGADSTTMYVQYLDFASAVQTGAISRTGTNSVLYTTTSDARLKADIIESERGLDALMAIKVSDYKMGKTANQGLLAQDVAKVYPEAVHEGGKDPNLQPWMLDYGRLTPLLIKGMQQQQEMIAALQAKVAALESATVH